MWFLTKKQKQNRPIPQWIQMKTGDQGRDNSKKASAGGRSQLCKEPHTGVTEGLAESLLLVYQMGFNAGHLVVFKLGVWFAYYLLHTS